MQSLVLAAASLLSPFFLDVTPEVRSSYVSIGKLMEDRPMQVTNVRAGYDAGDFGRFGVRLLRQHVVFILRIHLTSSLHHKIHGSDTGPPRVP